MKSKWIAGIVVVVVIFVAGFVAALRFFAHPAANQPRQVTIVTDASHATFTYMVPSSSKDWQMASQPPQFDQTKGVVSYMIHSKANNTDVTISQQPMPAALKSQNSSAFNQFMVNSNVVLSEPAGSGKLYFRAAQTVGNGSSGSGGGTASTVIFTAPSVLMFAAAGTPLKYAAWVQLMSSMQLK